MQEYTSVIHISSIFVVRRPVYVRLALWFLHHPVWMESHTGGSRLTPTVHPCPVQLGRLWVACVSYERNVPQQKKLKTGPPNIWDTSGISGNVFANPQASSSAPYLQELNSRWKKTIEEPLHMSTAEKSDRPERNQDLRCQSGPSAKDSVIFSGGDCSKNYGADPTTTADFGSPF